MDNKFHFERLRTNLVKMKHELPIILANHAQNFFVASFTKQGWDGVGWKEVNRRQPGTSEYKYPKFKGLSRRTSPILVRTGRLRRAVSNSIKSSTFQSVRLVVDLPQANAINEGDSKINLPRRRYMGNSPILMEQQQAKIKNYINKLF